MNTILQRFFSACTLSVILFFPKSSFAALDEIPTQKLFRDISAEHQFSEAVSYLKFQNIIHGYPDGSFRADQIINRAEFAKVLARSRFADEAIDGCVSRYTEKNSKEVFFPDVSKNSWFGKYVCMLKINRMMTGFTDGSFKPSDTITLKEAAQVTVKAFGHNIPSDTPWYKPFEDWYYPYIEDIGSRQALPESLVNFDKAVTRGEMAEIIYRLKAYNILNNKGSVNYNDIKTKSWENYDNELYGYRLSYPADSAFIVDGLKASTAPESGTMVHIGDEEGLLLNIAAFSEAELSEIIGYDAETGESVMKSFAEALWFANSVDARKLPYKKQVSYITKRIFAGQPALQFSVSGRMTELNGENISLENQYTVLIVQKGNMIYRLDSPSYRPHAKLVTSGFRFYK